VGTREKRMFTLFEVSVRANANVIFDHLGGEGFRSRAPSYAQASHCL